MARICILGLGYIGLPTASMFAVAGQTVIGVDPSPRVREALQQGRLPIEEPELETLVTAALQSGHLRVRAEPEPADAFIIAVPTPLQNGQHADLSYVERAARDIVPLLRRGNLVVLESTVPPGTTRTVLAPILAESGLQPGRDLHVAHCPERVLPGRIMLELVQNDRLAGGLTPECAEHAAELYSAFVKGAIMRTDATTAEMVKVMENTYRDVNVALANEFALIAEHIGVNVWEAIALANHHPRVNVLRPGPGVGGHCIAVDPWFLADHHPLRSHCWASPTRQKSTTCARVPRCAWRSLPSSAATTCACATRTSRRVPGACPRQCCPSSKLCVMWTPWCSWSITPRSASSTWTWSPRWSDARRCSTRATRWTSLPGSRAGSRRRSSARLGQSGRNARVHSRALRFSPSATQLLALDAAVGVLAYAAAMWLRFLDEGVPGTYAQRLLPWLIVGALVQVGVGEMMNRLRKPGSVLAHRPLAPFLVGGLVALVPTAFNELLGEPWHLPHSVAIVAPLLAVAGSAALRLAASRTFDAEELLHRPIVELDVAACAPALAGKRVLITGGAGSIGAELARQVLAVRPSSVVAVDMNETGLYELEGDLAALGAGVLRTCIADVADERRMHELFLRERPQVVFHAAAYKHVPLVEANPDQAFVSNVLGTLFICEAAVAAGVERIVVISTDKAVNPSSFMGVTKRVAELIATAAGERSAGSVFSVVRFGNVLGSRGSVIPTLVRQIEVGGPITITHPDVRRFFMTLSEAASLVLLSSVLGTPGGVFVLDMGHDVRIVDLAERLVRLKGLRVGRDIIVRTVGLRPGEKLREELCSADETLVPTAHPAVRRVQTEHALDAPRLIEGVRELDAQRRAGALEPADYATRLRLLIDTALQPPVTVLSS